MRKLLWFTIGFGAATFLAASIYGGWILLMAAIVLLLSGVLFALRNKFPWLKRASLIALGFAVGLCWFGLYDTIFVTVPRVADGQIGTVQIEASDYSRETDYGISVEGYVQLAGRSYKVKAFLNDRMQIQPGDQIAGTFRLRLTTQNDFSNYSAEGIFLLAYPVLDATVTQAQSVSWRYYPVIWRQQLLERIHQLFPDRVGGFVAALLLGDRTGIDYEMNTAFRVSGISHVIAVSGMHVSILFGMIFVLTAKKRLLTCIIGIPVLFLFSAVAGFTPSITRACIMQSLMLLSMAVNREYDPPTALACSALLMLLWNPMTILSASFQLSVSCMIGIFAFSGRIHGWLRRIWKCQDRKGIIKGFLEAIAMHMAAALSATVTTAPLVAYYFGNVSLVGVLTNVCTLWLISLIFYGSILCLLVSAVSMGIAGILTWLLAFPVEFVLRVTGLFAKLPMAAVYTVDPYVTAWLVGAYALFIVFLFQKKKRPILLGSCVIVTLLLAQLLSWIEPLQDDFRMTVLNVGQGQSILLQSDGKNYLVDCGGDDGEMAADVTSETLLSQGITRLDGIIVTHYDDDHTGGIGPLLTRIETDMLILPLMEDEKGVGQSLMSQTDGAVQFVDQDMLITFGSTSMTLIAPFSYKMGNESSLCVLFQTENCDILVTGDRGELGELMLLHERTLPDIEILVAGHHGSAYSTGEKLLAATKPEIVVISAGLDNRYGHPSEKTLQRLAAIGCAVYRTDLDGTITLRG